MIFSRLVNRSGTIVISLKRLTEFAGNPHMAKQIVHDLVMRGLLVKNQVEKRFLLIGSFMKHLIHACDEVADSNMPAL